MSEWINIEDRLHGDGEDIFFNAPGCYGVEKGHRFDTKWISVRTSPYNDRVSFVDAQVNYWMPLPELPK